NTLDNLLMNPTLSDLVGGIESVTLSDEEARRRGTQKTVLERRSPPTFDVLVEIQERQKLLIHDDVARSVDSLLRGKPPIAQLRYRGENGDIQEDAVRAANARERVTDDLPEGQRSPAYVPARQERLKEIPVYSFGVARNRLRRAAQTLKVPIEIVDSMGNAQVMVTTKQHYRKRPKVVVDAERRGVPVYVLRANTVAQMESFLSELFRLGDGRGDSALQRAMRETEEAISRINGGRGAIDLSPQNAYIRRRQHEMAQAADLDSRSYGKEPYRHVRIINSE
ncbi:MAG: R3H domain-containing nucleic acid-binding protein, partial [Anaerolineae bacterium]